MLISEDLNIPIPDWFRKKYDDLLNFNNNNFPISTKFEIKTYSDRGIELVKDIRKVISSNETLIDPVGVVFIWLHECGGVTKFKIYKDKIVYSEPMEWGEVKNITHWHCNKCSEVD